MAKKQKHRTVVAPAAPKVAAPALETHGPAPYPKALYRAIKTPEVAYDTALVGDRDAHAAHAADGWVDHPNDLTKSVGTHVTD